MAESGVPEGYVGVEAAARRLGVSRTKVWRLVKEGRLAARADVLDRRRRLIAVADLDRLVADRVEEQSHLAQEDER